MIFTLIVAPLWGIYYIHTTPDLYVSTVTEALALAGSQYKDWTSGAKGIFDGFMIARTLLG